MNQLSIPTLESIRQNRRFQELDLFRMFKEGKIEKDYKGFYFYEFFDDSQIKNVIYFEESFLYIENRILSTYEKADIIYKKILSHHGNSDIIIDFHFELIQVDYQLYLLLSVYTGSDHQPFMSPKRMEDWLKEQTSLKMELALITNKIETPLNSYLFMKQRMGERAATKQIQKRTSYQDFNTSTKKESHLLKAYPYRMNQDKSREKSKD